MEQIEITINLEHVGTEIRESLPWLMQDLGFEGFMDKDNAFSAFISNDLYDRKGLIKFLAEYHLSEDSFTETRWPDKNWNEEWERNFESVIIDGKCHIRAPFHQTNDLIPIEIIIEPKMSFGTGHHATTWLMISKMLTFDFKGKSVLDAGCGTGILSILAEKLGAVSITAVDIDDWSFKNAQENMQTNGCRNIRTILGDVSSVSEKFYDIILANINLNIHLAAMANYAACLNYGGSLFVSGILETDIPILIKEAEKHTLTFVCKNILNHWGLCMLKKM